VEGKLRDIFPQLVLAPAFTITWKDKDGDEAYNKLQDKQKSIFVINNLAVFFYFPTNIFTMITRSQQAVAAISMKKKLV
jgi:hypothetical protein